MTFEVKFRNAKGGIEYVRLEADSRSALFTELDNRKIKAINVSPIARQQKRGMLNRKAIGGLSSLRPSKILIGLLALFVLGVSAVCYVLISTKPHHDEAPIVLKHDRRVSHTDAHISQVYEDGSLPESNVVETVHKNVDDAVIERRELRKRMTPEERDIEKIEHMRQREIDLTPTEKRPFKTGLELGMARIFMTKLGSMPPPAYSMKIAIQDEAHLEQILTANNPALEGDSEQVKEAKEMVALAKDELRKYVQEGGSPSDFMEFYYNKLVDAHQQRQMAQKELMNLIKSDPDIAQEFYREANKLLSEKGIQHLRISDSLKQRLGWED